MSNRFVIKDTSVEELMSVDTTGKFNVPIAQGESVSKSSPITFDGMSVVIAVVPI